MIIEHFIRDKDLLRLKEIFPNELWVSELMIHAKGPQFFWDLEEQQEDRAELRVMREQGYL